MLFLGATNRGVRTDRNEGDALRHTARFIGLVRAAGGDKWFLVRTEKIDCSKPMKRFIPLTLSGCAISATQRRQI